MSHKSLYMIAQVDRTKNIILLEKTLFNKKVEVRVSEEEAAMYEELLSETSEVGSFPYVEYDEKRGVIVNGL